MTMFVIKEVFFQYFLIMNDCCKDVHLVALGKQYSLNAALNSSEERRHVFLMHV